MGLLLAESVQEFIRMVNSGTLGRKGSLTRNLKPFKPLRRITTYNNIAKI